ncbi:MAG TPA: hypothetical protein VKA60_03865 [Blastocatellia bacterium]|nr:hypothetical protein [Blastocatellia bacterium]
MKKMTLKAMAMVALPIMLILASAQIPASGQAKAKRIVGTWRTQGTVINCQNGAAIRTFLGLDVFTDSGSALATGSSNPALTSTGYGAWEHAGGRSFTNTLVAFRFNADGSYAGTQKITRQIELDGSGDQFTSTNSLEIADAAGNVIATACSTETGTRME